MKLNRQANKSADLQAVGIRSAYLSMTEIIPLKKRRVSSPACEYYINCELLLSSVTELERLWSMAKRILKYNRKLMNALVFEVIVFSRSIEDTIFKT